jgi:Amyotrophic lateral sclerosis 2 chromosomal region candidate gene 8
MPTICKPPPSRGEWLWPFTCIRVPYDYNSGVHVFIQFYLSPAFHIKLHNCFCTYTLLINYTLAVKLDLYLCKQDMVSCFTVDKRVSAKIKDLYSCGVKRLTEMRRHVRLFVQNELFANQPAPPRNDARFWPSSRTMLNHMYQAMAQQR